MYVLEAPLVMPNFQTIFILEVEKEFKKRSGNLWTKLLKIRTLKKKAYQMQLFVVVFIVTSFSSRFLE